MLKADALFAMGADDGGRYQEALAAYRALAADAGLSPSVKLAVEFKIGRTLEKMRRTEDAMDQYYSNVVLAYYNGSHRGEWFDDSARAFFARAAFALADHHEAKGVDRQERRVLRSVARSDVPAADEARKRIERIEEKGRFL
jgi:endonuclease I